MQYSFSHVIIFPELLIDRNKAVTNALQAVEDGLQKVYCKEDIVARIYAMADWFTLADIEAPTLEWVCFSDRKTGKELRISDIPPVIFSEVMRDVDLAVSVAHAGGVDPETSHSMILEGIRR
jgi:hypothetical protein